MAAVADTFTVLRDAAGRNPALSATALGGLAVVVLAALLIPVGLPDAGTAGRLDPVLDPEPVQVAETEDLSAFLAGQRWGIVLQDIIDEEAAAAAAAALAAREIEMTRELAEIGFVGLMVEPHGVRRVAGDGGW